MSGPSLDELNRSLNRSLRTLNNAANTFAKSSLADRMIAVDEIAQALELIMGVQKRVIREDPNLEYHHDPKRAPTDFMRKVESAMQSADAALQAGDEASARKWFARALSMEPPPLAYEVIAKRLSAFEGDARSDE